MKIIVCGSRDYLDRDKVFESLDMAHAKTPITGIIHGACCDRYGKLKGADRWAEEWAIVNEVPYMGCPAKWKKLGKPAGPIRNGQMLKLGPDGVVAFPGGVGTQDMVEQAEKAGVRVWKPYG